MINELTVLKSLKHCKAIVKKLDSESKKLALSSFCAANIQNGTLGQMRQIAQLVCKRDLTKYYFQTVVDALADMPQGYRTLLFSVYIKNFSKTDLCEKYGVSVATLYRKLAHARKIFAQNLHKAGGDESWFGKIFDALEKFCRCLQKHSFDDAYDAYCDALQL